MKFVSDILPILISVLSSMSVATRNSNSEIQEYTTTKATERIQVRSDDEYVDLKVGHTSEQGHKHDKDVQTSIQNKQQNIDTSVMSNENTVKQPEPTQQKRQFEGSEYNSSCFNWTLYSCGDNITMADRFMQPLLLLQSSPEGRKVLSTFSKSLQYLNAKGIKVLSDIFQQFNSSSPSDRGLIALLEHLQSSSDGRRFTNRVLTTLLDIPSPQIQALVSLISQITGSHGSIYALLQFLSGSVGHHLVDGLLGNTTTDILLRTVLFLSQLPNVPKTAILGRKGTPWVPSDRVLQYFYGGKDFSYPGQVNSQQHSHPTHNATSHTLELGDKCGRRCYVNNSACLSDDDGMMVCTCLPNFLKAINGSCVPAPNKLFLTTDDTFLVDPEAPPGTSVGFLPLLQHPGVAPSQLHMIAEIVPAQSSISALVQQGGVTIILESRLRQEEEHVVVVIHATSKYTHIHQVLSVKIVSKHSRESNQTFRTFLLDGTRKGSLLADLKCLSSNHTYSYNISQSDPFRIANVLFTLTPNWKVILARDVSLLELSGSHLTASFELYFEVRRQVEGSSQFAPIAMFHILVIKDSIEHKVRENQDQMVILQNRLLPGDRSKFEIRLSNLADVFQYERESLKLRNALDYETEEERLFNFVMYISTVDGAIETSVAVTVMAVDVDDEPPEFLQRTYNFTLIHGAPRGTVLGIIEADDPDTPTRNLTYTLHGNNSKQFNIGQRGEITSRVIVEHTRFGRTFYLSVSASDGLSSSVRDCELNITIVTYHITKKNLSKTFIATIPENSPSGSPVISVAVRFHTNYHFTEFQDMFKLDPRTGRITTLKVLDRENSSQSVTAYTIMAVEAQDTFNNGCHQIIVGTLYINLTDVNDNSPQFSSNLFNVSLRENLVMNTPLFQTTILDDDEGENGTANFMLSGKDKDAFSVNTTDGKTVYIWIHEPLDREVAPSVHLTLTAKDAGQKKNMKSNVASTTIHIIVLDVNDNVPVFRPAAYLYNVSENTPTGNISTLKVTDADTGANGNVSFILERGGMGYINIHRQTGSLYTTRPLDRESISTFNITIRAFDDGEPQLTSLKWVLVNVLDENDHAPEFIDSNEMMTFQENQTCDRVILTVKAVDADTDNHISYHISSDTFRVNTYTGEIKCTRPLDYENQTTYVLTVTATDSGSPARNSSTKVRIDVEDVNDNQPIFEKPIYQTNVSRSTWAVNKTVFILRATDKDSGLNGRVVLSVTSGNVSNYFTLTSNLIRTTSNSPPPSGMYTMDVSASDLGFPRKKSPARLIIYVIANSSNVYTLNPTSCSYGVVKFVKDFHFEVFENRNYSLSSKPIGNIRASTPKGCSVRYSTGDNDPSGLFLVSATGDLYYNGQFDREETELHQLIVRTQNTTGSHLDSALVTVVVMDVNDNPPRFLWSPENINISVREDVRINTELAVLNATDLDIRQNGHITYDIFPQTDFSVDNETGILTVSNYLDADSPARNVYHLNITATDHGSPSLRSTMAVTIKVVDVNDNPPVFTRDRYTVYVMEDAKNHTQVSGKILPSAYDNDITNATNGWVVYQRNMTSIRNTCPFYLSQEGTINLNGQLDYERTKSYSCVITALDMPVDLQYTKTATAVVDIHVGDANDNAPVFQGTPYFFAISRDAHVDSVVTDTVEASDRDVEEGNGEILYSLYDSHYFRINPTTAEIRVQQPLHSAPTRVQMTVIASDQPKYDRSLTSNTTITVRVEGDCRPQFTKARYRGRVQEETDPPAFNLVVVGAWCQSHPGKYCTYNIQQTEFSEHFRINKTTGEVRQVRRLDREKTGGVIKLHVTATGDTLTVGTSTTVIDVTVDDINDNIPVFTQSQQIQVFNTSQEVPVGHVIGNILSYDPDDPTTSYPVYRAITYPVYRAIAKNKKIHVSSSGALIVSRPLVNPEVEAFTIKILVGVSDGEKLDDRADINRVLGQNTTSQVIIQVRQMTNSHAPVFTQDFYITDISPTASRNELVPVPGFRAEDEDGTSVTYVILDGNVRDVFLLNGTTGNLSLMYDVDNSLPDVINLTISALDSGIVRKSSTCLVMVRIGLTDSRQCYTTEQLNQKTKDATNIIYPIIIAVVAALLLVTVVAIIILARKLRRCGRLIDQLGSCNTVLTPPLDDKGRRMRYARASFDRDYREARPYTSLMADLSKIFYIEKGPDTQTGKQSRTSCDANTSKTEPDYESIGDESHTFIDHL